MSEGTYRTKLIKKIESRFEGSIILHNDPRFVQGIPDLIVIYKDKWAALETKKASNSSHRPNQDYYISKMNDMSYASFVSPENEEEVMRGLESTFEC